MLLVVITPNDVKSAHKEYKEKWPCVSVSTVPTELDSSTGSRREVTQISPMAVREHMLYHDEVVEKVTHLIFIVIN